MKKQFISITKSDIDEIFETVETQADAAEALYKLVLPEMFSPDCVSVKHWPTVSQPTSKYLFDKFIAFDKKHHPTVMSGGMWLNSGFSTDTGGKTPDWTADISTCEILYAEVERKVA